MTSIGHAFSLIIKIITLKSDSFLVCVSRAGGEETELGGPRQRSARFNFLPWKSHLPRRPLLGWALRLCLLCPCPQTLTTTDHGRHCLQKLSAFLPTATTYRDLILPISPEDWGQITLTFYPRPALS